MGIFDFSQISFNNMRFINLPLKSFRRRTSSSSSSSSSASCCCCGSNTICARDLFGNGWMWFLCALRTGGCWHSSELCPPPPPVQFTKLGHAVGRVLVLAPVWPRRLFSYLQIKLNVCEPFQGSFTQNRVPSPKCCHDSSEYSEFTRTEGEKRRLDHPVSQRFYQYSIKSLLLHECFKALLRVAGTAEESR